MAKKINNIESIEYALVHGEIKAGHGFASGKGKDERYPEGTLKQQLKTKENYFRYLVMLH
tara:strand:- start:1179 stop:1358 length:180 start_codon:yes stop_codon:yes gene_type:complete